MIIFSLMKNSFFDYSITFLFKENSMSKKLMSVLCGFFCLFLLSTSVLAQTTPTECTAPPTGVTPTLKVAVASNLWNPGQVLANAYMALTGNENKFVQICHNSTGILVPEIVADSTKYGLFLAANNRQEGVPSPYTLCLNKVPGTQDSICLSDIIPYTVGQLALFSNDPNIDLNNALDILNNNDLSKVGYADTILAPYGNATRQYLEFTFQWNPLIGSSKLAGPYPNIDLTYQSAITGNPPNSAAFIALSQSCSNGVPQGNIYKIPTDGYSAILQSGVVLRNTQSTNAQDFLNFILSAAGQNILAQFCYGPLPPAPKK
jgi:ABC-type molybdate transport system substrate-binding protein